MPKIEETARDRLEFICVQCDAEGKGEGIVERDAHYLKTCRVCGTENWCFLVGESRLTPEIPVVTQTGPDAEAESVREVAESNPEDIKIAVAVEDDKGEVIADTELRVDVDEEGNIDTAGAEEQIAELKRKLAELEAKQ